MFPLIPAFQHGWQSVKKFFWAFLPVTLIFSGLDYISTAILEQAGFVNVVDYATFMATITPDLIWKFGLIGLLTVVANFFAVTLSIAVIRKQSPAELIKARMANFLPFILLMIIKTLLISLGLMLFVVPGVVLVFALYLTEYIYVDRSLGLLDCIRESWKITQGYRFGIFFFEFDVFLISYLISFPQVFWPGTPITQLIIALANTILLPIIWNATTYVYDFISTASANRTESL